MAKTTPPADDNRDADLDDARMSNPQPTPRRQLVPAPPRPAAPGPTPFWAGQRGRVIASLLRCPDSRARVDGR